MRCLWAPRAGRRGCFSPWRWQRRRGGQQSGGPGTSLFLLRCHPCPSPRAQRLGRPQLSRGPAGGAGPGGRSQRSGDLVSQGRRRPRRHNRICEILFIFVLMGEVQCQNIWFVSHANYSRRGGGGAEGERHREEQEKEACRQTPGRAGCPAQGAPVPDAGRPGPSRGHPCHPRARPGGPCAPDLRFRSTLLASREAEMGEGGVRQQEQRARGPGGRNAATGEEKCGGLRRSGLQPPRGRLCVPERVVSPLGAETQV